MSDFIIHINAETMAIIDYIKAINFKPSKMVFSSDGKYLLCNSYKDKTVLIDWTTKTRINSIRHTKRISYLAISSSPYIVACAPEDNKNCVYDALSGRIIGTLGHPVLTLASIAVLSNGHLVGLYLTPDYRIRVIDIFSGTELGSYVFVKDIYFSCEFLISSDGKHILCNNSNSFYLIDTSTQETFDTESYSEGIVSDMWLSRDKQRVAFLDESELNCIMDLNTGKYINKFKGLPRCPPYPRCTALSNSETMQAVGDDEGNLYFWKPDNHDEPHIISSPMRTIRSVAFSHDESLLAYAGDNCTIVVLDTHTMKDVIVFNTEPFSAQKLAFTRNGNTLVSLMKGAIQFWDIVSQGLLLTLVRYENGQDFFAITPDFRYDCTERAKTLLHVLIDDKIMSISDMDICVYTPGLLAQVLPEFNISAPFP
jgi:WD40 repeat protein